MTSGPFDSLARTCHITAREKGFYRSLDELDLLDEASPYDLRTLGVLSRIALIGSEVGELTEAVRKPSKSDHVPELSLEEEELADIVIRILDYAHWRGISLDKAIELKMGFNNSRGHMHGKKA